MKQRSWVWFAGVLASGVCLSACTSISASLRSEYAEEFSCTDEDTGVDSIGGGRYRVTGCHRTVMYTCAGACVPDVSASSEPATHSASSAHSAKPASAAQENVGVAHREKNKAGASLIVLDLRVDKETLLKLRATPDAKRSADLTLLRLSSDKAQPECELACMIDGQRVSLPKARLTQSSANDDESRTFETLKTELSADLVHDLATARQLAFRRCDVRLSVPPEALPEVRHFAALYEEERAWAAPVRDGASGGLLAPAEGWPAWKVAGDQPAAVTAGNALDAPALFKALSPSVFRVQVVSADGRAQGSAVAIDKSELLTNCHVLEGAQKITLQQGKSERKATIARANPAADRCVLRVAEPNLTPIRGVRSYDELQVGEALFTLGSPSGLELSLANGILSGKREEDGRSYVQTTAPISPGSSGGGLFDARGNLIGITTMVLADRNHLNQSLNFAIPADAFWAP